MKLFKCQHCAQALHFDNRQCLNCGHRLGYLPDSAELLAVETADGGWRIAGTAEGAGPLYQFCANAEFDACTWLIDGASINAPESAKYCRACRHNRNIADLTVPENLQNWLKVERAKHHLFYTLLCLQLPLATRDEMPETGLAFDFLAEVTDADGHQQAVMTGHDNGIITLNLAEADDAYRERNRVNMGEPYRTLLGHLRHEIGHYFWDSLLSDDGSRQAFRGCFGDESIDYEAALKKYYADGPAPQWQDNYVSAYATAHPWEDFAETWAHYLHIVDTLEMTAAYGLRVEPSVDSMPAEQGIAGFDPYRAGTITQLIDVWLPITLALNSLNRCMGQADFYPFVIAPAVIAKLGFVHDLVRRTADQR